MHAYRFALLFSCCLLAACGGDKAGANGAQGDDGLPKPAAAAGSVTGMPDPGVAESRPAVSVAQAPDSVELPDDVAMGTSRPSIPPCNRRPSSRRPSPCRSRRCRRIRTRRCPRLPTTRRPKHNGEARPAGCVRRSHAGRLHAGTATATRGSEAARRSIAGHQTDGARDAGSFRYRGGGHLGIAR